MRMEERSWRLVAGVAPKDAVGPHDIFQPKEERKTKNEHSQTTDDCSR